MKNLLKRISIAYLPFADAASDDLPLGQLLRLSLFQISVGMAAVMLLGTLNRVMIVELQVPAFLVASMVALPVLIAPFRALLGFKSDTYKSAIGWKRIPYLWFGTLWQFGGLAIMPAFLLCLGGDVTQVRYGHLLLRANLLAGIAFLITGLCMLHDETAGFCRWRRPRDGRDPWPRGRGPAFTLMFLIGMAARLIIGWLLLRFTAIELIQVIQAPAVGHGRPCNGHSRCGSRKRQAMTQGAQREGPGTPPASADAWAD